MPRRCTQRSAPEVVQPVLAQKLSDACPLLDMKVALALGLLQQISLIAGPRHKTPEVPYAAQRRAYGLWGVPRCFSPLSAHKD
jgi:hypothetical protein